MHDPCAPEPAHPAVYSVVGKSDAGKTTVIEGLVPALAALGLRVGTIKHDVHGFALDHEGKDSWRHKRAGARVSLISSPWQVGMVRDVDHDHTIAELVAHLLADVDVVLTEGYRREDWPKVEVHRAALARGLISGPEDGLIAVVTDEALAVAVPQFSFAELTALAALLAQRCAARPPAFALP
jgi:molybdopterin-guanine dinucleotide biosynthesis protein B